MLQTLLVSCGLVAVFTVSAQLKPVPSYSTGTPVNRGVEARNNGYQRQQLRQSLRQQQFDRRTKTPSVGRSPARDQRRQDTLYQRQRQEWLTTPLDASAERAQRQKRQRQAQALDETIDQPRPPTAPPAPALELRPPFKFPSDSDYPLRDRR